MPRIVHGSNSIQLEEAPLLPVEDGDNGPAIAVVTTSAAAAAAASPAAAAAPHFTYLFTDLLGKPANFLPDVAEAPTILGDLKALGMSMRDDKHEAAENSIIPSGYTYFGQFLDHDISHTDVKKPEGETDSSVLNDDNQLSPWPLNRIHEEITNKRASILELDCVYGLMPAETEGGERKPPPRSADNPEKMALGGVTKTGGRPPGKPDDWHDLPRQGKDTDGKHDRSALIADPRNDSNLIVSQLHVAFLRAHNELVRRGNSFDQARLTLRNCYHWIIANDFLMKIADPEVVNQVRARLNLHYDPPVGSPVSLPLEFTVAAYRFGHSMVRKHYYISDSAPFVSLRRLFMLIVLGKSLNGPTPGEGDDTLREKMIIQWKGFLPGPDIENQARQINTSMVEPLFTLLDERDMPVGGERSLAVQDLKRGYMLGLPTGQAVAKSLEITNPITSQEIEECARRVSAKQLDALTRQETKLSSRTPLWFYILAEAKIRGKGNHLGPVGSRLVAEVLIGLIRRIPDSFLNTGWKPGDLGFQKDEFTLKDLLRLAQVL